LSLDRKCDGLCSATSINCLSFILVLFYKDQKQIKKKQHFFITYIELHLVVKVHAFMYFEGKVANCLIFNKNYFGLYQRQPVKFGARTVVSSSKCFTLASEVEID